MNIYHSSNHLVPCHLSQYTAILPSFSLLSLSPFFLILSPFPLSSLSPLLYYIVLSFFWACLVLSAHMHVHMFGLYLMPNRKRMSILVGDHTGLASWDKEMVTIVVAWKSPCFPWFFHYAPSSNKPFGWSYPKHNSLRQPWGCCGSFDWMCPVKHCGHHNWPVQIYMYTFYWLSWPITNWFRAWFILCWLQSTSMLLL